MSHARTQSHWSFAFARLGIPQIVTFHDSTGRVAEWLRPLRENPHVRVRFISEFQRDAWAVQRAERSRSFFLHHGLRREQFELCLPSATEEEPYHLWVAGLKWGPKKGINIFLDLANRNPNEQFRAYGGGDQSGRVVPQLRQMEKMLPNFKFLGELKRGKQHSKVFCGAKTFVMPTLLPEAFGLTIIEAFSKGTPVIGSVHGALPELIGRDSVMGVVADDVKTMSMALHLPYNRTRVHGEALRRFSSGSEVEALLVQSHKLLSLLAAGAVA